MWKERVIIFGAGGLFQSNEEQILDRYEIVGIFDNDSTKWGTCSRAGYTIEGAECLSSKEYDKVLVVSAARETEMARELMQRGVDSGKILFWISPEWNAWDHVSLSWSAEQAKITADADGITFALQTSTGATVFNEVFIHNEYSFSIGDEPCAVFDIGMNEGLASLYFASYANVTHVYGFEPFPMTYEKAIGNFRMNRADIRDKIKAFPFGLSDGEREEEFTYLPEFPGHMRTVHDGPDDWSKTAERLKAHVVLKDAGNVLSDLFAKHADKNIVMKIDCEGAEYGIFKSLSREGLIAKVRIYIMETHYGKEAMIKKLLKENGFAFFDQYSGGPSKIGKIYAVNTRPRGL